MRPRIMTDPITGAKLIFSILYYLDRDKYLANSNFMYHEEYTLYSKYNAFVILAKITAGEHILYLKRMTLILNQ